LLLIPLVLFLKKTNKQILSDVPFVSLFVCLWPPEQFFSYLAAVTITDERVANLDIYMLSTYGF
jgi:hypothetical protein